MLPMADPTLRSVFPTATAAAAVPGTPLTERAAAPRRICRERTARVCFIVSQLTRLAGKAHDQEVQDTCLHFRLVCVDADLLPDGAGSAKRAEYAGRHTASGRPHADSGTNDFFRHERGHR